MWRQIGSWAALCAVVALVAAVAWLESAWWATAVAGLALSVCLAASLVERRAEGLAVQGAVAVFAAVWMVVGLEAGLWALIGASWLSSGVAAAALVRFDGTTERERETVALEVERREQ